MEGSIARWYARTRGTDEQRGAWTRQAAELTRGLPAGGSILEVAPGPGFFAIELARAGDFHVSALDASRTFVGIVSENAHQAGVSVDVRHGDAAEMPFSDRSFDLIVCQAAFKNFSRPQAAMDEMHRVARPGGLAWIEDMRRDATDAALRTEVRGMHLPRLRGWLTLRALRGLRRRAYSIGEFEEFARRSPFGGCDATPTTIGVEIRMCRPVETA